MIERALYEHLKDHVDLVHFLTRYNKEPAVFNQEAPADNDPLWAPGPQYGRIIFAVDIQGEPGRTMGGVLSVDIMCADGEYTPEDVEPFLRAAIDGYFFSNGTFTVSAQWKNSNYFTEPTDHVSGCTLMFDLLAFPVMSTGDPDVVARINAWSAVHDGIHVINHDTLPRTAWKPTEGDIALYWRLVQDSPAGWIPDTFQTIWRTATLRGHVFAQDLPLAVKVARNIIAQLYTDKRLKKEGESPIMVNQRNRVEQGSDPLRTGQIEVEATYAIIVHIEPDEVLENITHEEGSIQNGNP